MSFLFKKSAKEETKDADSGGMDDMVEHDPEVSVSKVHGMGDGEMTAKVAAIRSFFVSKGTDLQLPYFIIGSTLGTGTFGRVRLVKCKIASAAVNCSSSSSAPASSSTDDDGSLTEVPLALKMLKKREIIRLKQVEHIRSEKEILTKISHPFIVDFYGTFQDQNRVYMIMEYVIGGELFSQLRSAGRFSNDTSRFYAAEIVLALQYLHKFNIVYRDLKPENLLLDKEGHIKITDFGFAKIVEDRTWTLCGTPEYLAPEIIQSKGHGKAVDWWALGILIYEMLAGYPPFYDENPFGIYQKILSGRLEFPRHFDPNAKDLVKRLLTADRSKRYGCLKNGAEDIKRHKWFKGIDWDEVYARKLTPPIVPDFNAEDDTANFDQYNDSPDDTVAPLFGNDQEVFQGF
eukprot:TRINITY_DN80123_c0_g1_i1.p1 TRINITY_DN80123_c0_g1~~TRINITY_DN80123_c0_g1_i1.p1  ORF type:complete len:402 (+),score=95.02 TRINITY_DN80123_c0_g1_i1:143-1348(+)